MTDLAVSLRRRAAHAVLRLLIALATVSLLTVSCGDDDDDRNPAGIGNRCVKNEDCSTNNCYLGPGGGYCTSTSSIEGDTAACPPDTVCKPIQVAPNGQLLRVRLEHDREGLRTFPAVNPRHSIYQQQESPATWRD